jgi:hypothetical protein
MKSGKTNDRQSFLGEREGCEIEFCGARAARRSREISFTSERVLSFSFGKGDARKGSSTKLCVCSF